MHYLNGGNIKDGHDLLMESVEMGDRQMINKIQTSARLAHLYHRWWTETIGMHSPCIWIMNEFTEEGFYYRASKTVGYTPDCVWIPTNRAHFLRFCCEWDRRVLLRVADVLDCDWILACNDSGDVSHVYYIFAYRGGYKTRNFLRRASKILLLDGGIMSCVESPAEYDNMFNLKSDNLRSDTIINAWYEHLKEVYDV